MEFRICSPDARGTPRPLPAPVLSTHGCRGTNVQLAAVLPTSWSGRHVLPVGEPQQAFPDKIVRNPGRHLPLQIPRGPAYQKPPSMKFRACLGRPWMACRPVLRSRGPSPAAMRPIEPWQSLFNGQASWLGYWLGAGGGYPLNLRNPSARPQPRSLGVFTADTIQ